MRRWWIGVVTTRTAYLSLILASVLSLTATPQVAAVDGPFSGYDYDFPRAISYRLLSRSGKVECGRSDTTFRSQVQSLGLDQYSGLVVDGTRGTCERRKSEQFKRLFPTKMVLNYAYANGNLPTARRGGIWPGYYLMMNRSTVTGIPSTAATSFSVTDPGRFSIGDIALMWQEQDGDPFGRAEYLKVNSISGATLSVTRGWYSLPSQVFTAPPRIAALLASPSGPEPLYNLSDMAPVNPANGKRANRWLADWYVRDFAPSTSGAPTLDGYELDVAQWTPRRINVNGGIKNLDCNLDGTVDHCNKDIGTPEQTNSYGVGYEQFVRMLKQGLAAYDTDPSRPPKMVLGDSPFRSIDDANGAEFESFPNWDNYGRSSSALSDLGFFVDKARSSGPHVSYAFTKEITPLYGIPSRQNPNGCIEPPKGTCRNGSYRYGLVASLVTGAFHAYADEYGYFNHPVGWDEDGGVVNAGSTTLGTGYLGQPLGPPVRQPRFTSPNLALNPTFESTLTDWRLVSQPGTTVQAALDVVAASPLGSGSLKVSVSRVLPDPSMSDLSVKGLVKGPIEADSDYTISFWARAAGGHPVSEMRVSLSGVAGKDFSQVKLGGDWRRYVLDVRTETNSLEPAITFAMGEDTGSYWLDGVTVRKGSGGLITRQFEHGIAVLNDSASVQYDVALPGGTYRKIAGVQDPVVNDGSYVGSRLASIAPKDGLVLLR